MEELKEAFKDKHIPEGGSVEIHFEIMKPWIKDKKTVMEIGFNAGFGAAWFLENGADKVVSFDICQYGHEQMAHDVLEKKFPGKHTLVKGDSMKTIPDYQGDKFDFIFIDGYHWGQWPEMDMRNCAQWAHENTIVIVDNISFKVDSQVLRQRNWPENKYYNVTDAWNKVIMEKIIEPYRIDCRYENGNVAPSCMGIGKYNHTQYYNGRPPYHIVEK